MSDNAQLAAAWARHATDAARIAALETALIEAQAVAEEHRHEADSCRTAWAEVYRLRDALEETKSKADTKSRAARRWRVKAEGFEAKVVRLTAERDRQYDENVHRIAEQAKAEAEVARLRDALEATKAKPGPDCTTPRRATDTVAMKPKEKP